MTTKLTEKENKKLVKEMTASIKAELDLKAVAKQYGITYGRLSQIRTEIRRLLRKPYRKVAKIAPVKSPKTTKTAKATKPAKKTTKKA